MSYDRSFNKVIHCGSILSPKPRQRVGHFLFNYRLTVLNTMVKPYAVTEMFLRRQKRCESEHHNTGAEHDVLILAKKSLKLSF